MRHQLSKEGNQSVANCNQLTFKDNANVSGQEVKKEEVSHHIYKHGEMLLFGLCEEILKIKKRQL